MNETARYTQLAIVAKALAKIEKYDNVVFATLYKDLKQMMMISSSAKSFGEGSGIKSLKNELAQLNIFLKYDNHKHQSLEKVGYLVILEQYDRDFKFEQKKVLMRHNLHNKIADELKKKKIKFEEEVNRKYQFTQTRLVL